MATQSPHRYWRVYFTAGGSGGVFSLAEAQFRVTPGTPLLFSGGAVNSLSSYNAGTNPNTNLADNNINTWWASATANPGEWWEYDYGSGNTLAVQEVTLTARNDSAYTQAPTTFQVQWSDDNASWNSANSFTATTWSSAGQTQTFTIPLGATQAQLTQIAIEQWAQGSPAAQLTQIAVEQWASSFAIAPPVGPAYMISGSRAGLSATAWSTTTRSFMVPLSATLAEAPVPAPPPPTGGAVQARVMVMA